LWKFWTGAFNALLMMEWDDLGAQLGQLSLGPTPSGRISALDGLALIHRRPVMSSRALALKLNE
jgi:hypothetical protein